MFQYPMIDSKCVGKKIRMLLHRSGYSVKELQEMLQLSHPQPIYRWMQGKILPSIGHMYAMSKIFDVHMEELIEWYEEQNANVTFALVIDCYSQKTEEVYLMERLKQYHQHCVSAFSSVLRPKKISVQC